MKKTWILISILITTASLALGALLTLLIEQGFFFAGWMATSFLLGISFAILYLLHKKAGSARLLGWMIVAAFFLRLGLGVGLMKALPVVGYDTNQQKAGYVFFDAFRRDTQAVNIARSDKPIYSVFTKQYATDQYGGYLGLSILTYRELSGGEHRPHLMLILSALVAAAGVPFLWMLLSRLGKERWRKFAGWWYVLYPQAVLLGASQMREPYLITFVTIVFWAALEWQHSGFKNSWGWMLTGVAGMLLFSPGFAVLSLVIISVWVWLDRSSRKIQWWVIPVVSAVVILGLFALSYGLARQSHFVKDSPLEVIFNWLRNAAAWDLSLTQGASGQLEYQLKALPEWAKLPFIVIYGVLQPVLPATLMDTAAWIWRFLSSWLAGGWYLMLPLLIYGTLAAFNEKDNATQKKMLWLAAVIWFWIILCSVRAGGDQWDNPRYRTIILVFLAIFAAWAWHRAKEHGFIWLKRIVLVEGIFLVFFLQWYAARYYRIFLKLPFYWMVAAILFFSTLVIVGGMILDKKRAKRLK
ncbi:MAG: hypothetical protein C0391_02555 [Anaerolinea sp.]|nr:hypothetical protein [Anaerolinea sp.]